MRRVLRLLLELVVAALSFVAITIAWIIVDGLSDSGDGADAALVSGPEGYSGGAEPHLDRVATLFKNEQLNVVIVSPIDPAGGEAVAIMKYLEQHGVPSSAILEDAGDRKPREMARDVAEIMKSHQLTSLMLVDDYYRMSRLKLMLLHVGVNDIRKAHLGSLSAQDAVPIACEVLALYEYVGRTYLMPAAKKIKEEAVTASDKAKSEAERAKDSVNRGLDALPK